MKAGFGGAAAWYEPLLGRILRALRDEVLALCPDRGWLLDCCCGPGGLLQRLHGSADLAGLKAMGLDRDAAMLREAASLVPRPVLLHGDATGLPLADHSVDAACVCMALHAMPWQEAQQALQELRRVAGVVIVADYCLAERNISLPAVAVAHAVERLVGGVHYQCYRDFMRKGGLEGLVAACGHVPCSRRTVLGGAVRVLALRR